MASIIKRTLSEATQISEQEENDIWHKMPESPFRKLIQYYAEVRMAQEQEKLTGCTVDNFQKQQGVVEGIGIVLGIMARKDPLPGRK